MQKLVLAFKVMVLFLAASVQADEKNELIFYESDSSKGPTAILTWDSKEHLCRLKMSGKKDIRDLKKENCKEIIDLLSTNDKELKKLNKSGFDVNQRRKREGAHLPLARIEFNGMKFGILKTSPEQCDLGGKNCKPTSDLIIDQIGFKVLDLMEQP